jgi:hypothetical protein
MRRIIGGLFLVIGAGLLAVVLAVVSGHEDLIGLAGAGAMLLTGGWLLRKG